MRRRYAAVAGLLAGVLAGCSGAPDAAGPMSPSTAQPSDDGHGNWDVTAMPDPCRTITRAEVAPIVKVPVEPGSRLESWPPLCNFPLPGPPLNFLYVSDDSRPAAKEDFDRQRTDSSAAEPVTGVGDQGYWLPEFQALHVFRGATHLTVKFAGTPPVADGKNKAIALARIALPRTIAPS
ncbi:MAG TPA: hypothetical protein VES42_09590 [Pilimelia sp.]|nr:hypothetical protein [Pilimelia sp.]